MADSLVATNFHLAANISGHFTAQAFDVRSIPTLIFFKDGEPLFEMVGAISKPVLERELRALLES